MMRQDVLVGSVVAFLCLLLIVYERWFLEKTGNGRRLIRWFGPDRGRWVLRGLAVAGILFGILLASGVIRPIQW